MIDELKELRKEYKSHLSTKDGFSTFNYTKNNAPSEDGIFKTTRINKNNYQSASIDSSAAFATSNDHRRIVKNPKKTLIDTT